MKRPLNYLYFGCLFVCLAIVHALHMHLVYPRQPSQEAFFIALAIAQCFVQTVVIAWLLSLARTRLSKIWTGMAISLTLVFFVLQLIDFPMIRLMGMSVWFAIDIVLAETSKNFVEMLLASNVSLFVWIVAALSAGGLVAFGIFCFYQTEKKAAKKPIELSLLSMLKICAVPMVMLALAEGFILPEKESDYQKALPWKRSFFPQASPSYSASSALKPLNIHEPSITAASVQKKPDVFLFVIESLRDDFINFENAPHLFQFKKENISFPLSMSNSNATHLSWFCLFNSQFPFTFSQIGTQSGSLPMRTLKKMGYEIYVYSTARLSFYQMDRRIFGKDLELANQITYFHDHESGVPSHESDLRCISALQQKLESDPKSGGRVFVIFLDSTHFDYSWPDEKNPRFTPILDQVNHLKIACSLEDIEKIKNRYRNSIHYVDSLFGKTVGTLKKLKQWKDAVIVMTGDHGEEFYEHGHIFHATALSDAQTRVPLYYKFGEKRVTEKRLMTSHVDVFPSIFDYLIGDELSSYGLQGESVFHTPKWPYTVAGRYNGSRSPNEFFIHNGTYKLTLNRKGSSFDLLSAKDLFDVNVSYDVQWVKENFGGAIESVFAK
jgi:glucan phosphoethanolaminetransferase (alkaline phosphatase superfamily)